MFDSDLSETAPGDFVATLDSLIEAVGSFIYAIGEYETGGHDRTAGLVGHIPTDVKHFTAPLEKLRPAAKHIDDHGGEDDEEY